MRTIWIAVGLLLAVCLTACSDEVPIAAEPADDPAQVTEADAPRQRSAPEPENRPRSEAAATVVQSETRERQSDPAQEVQAEPAVESEADAVEESDADDVPESEARDLTEVPAVVVGDAEMRVRPGLAWGVNRQLAVGDEVLVLSRSRGWLQVRVDACEGWVRSDALDLGEVDESDILEQPAAPIVAEWQGVEYGVMGQSADAAEVRLLSESDEIVSAPKDELTLLADDITVDDLPVLIGDETVVFPGDDFRARQGKILPRADEWMWLPWGWLLAHNKEFIWQWRPETDELEFIRRPKGPAKLSPIGDHLAILASPDETAYGGTQFRNIIVLPLDGSVAISLRRQVDDAIDTGRLSPQFANHLLRARSAIDLSWSADGTAIAVRLYPETQDTYFFPALVMNTSGEVTIHHELPDGIPQGFDCYYGSLGGNTSLLDWWWLREDSTFAIYALCETDEDGRREEFDIVFNLRGEFLRAEPFSWGRDNEEAVSLVRSAPSAQLLGERLLLDWSPKGRYALVLDRDSALLLRYDAKLHRLQEFSFASGTGRTVDLNMAGLIPSIARWRTRSALGCVLARRCNCLSNCSRQRNDLGRPVP